MPSSTTATTSLPEATPVRVARSSITWIKTPATSIDTLAHHRIHTINKLLLLLLTKSLKLCQVSHLRLLEAASLITISKISPCLIGAL